MEHNRMMLGRLMHDAHQYLTYGSPILWAGAPRRHALHMLAFWLKGGLVCSEPVKMFNQVWQLLTWVEDK